MNKILSLTICILIINSGLSIAYEENTDKDDESIQYKVMDIDTTSPLKLFEYMASKRPIIASNISTIAKIVKNDFSAKLSSSKKNYESIIKELLNNKNKCLYLAENAFHEATKYTWRNRCKNILNNLVYNKA